VAADGATVAATDAAADDCADDDELMCALPSAGTSTARFVSSKRQILWSIK
jgi:hypothetical protein